MHVYDNGSSARAPNVPLIVERVIEDVSDPFFKSINIWIVYNSRDVVNRCEFKLSKLITQLRVQIGGDDLHTFYTLVYQFLSCFKILFKIFYYQISFLSININHVLPHLTMSHPFIESISIWIVYNSRSVNNGCEFKPSQRITQLMVEIQGDDLRTFYTLVYRFI